MSLLSDDDRLNAFDRTTRVGLVGSALCDRDAVMTSWQASVLPGGATAGNYRIYGEARSHRAAPPVVHGDQVVQSIRRSCRKADQRRPVVAGVLEARVAALSRSLVQRVAQGFDHPQRPRGGRDKQHRCLVGDGGSQPS